MIFGAPYCDRCVHPDSSYRLDRSPPKRDSKATVALLADQICARLVDRHGELDAGLVVQFGRHGQDRLVLPAVPIVYTRVAVARHGDDGCCVLFAAGLKQLLAKDPAATDAPFPFDSDGLLAFIASVIELQMLVT